MLLADTLVVIGLATANIGTIHEADGPVEHVFYLRNAGQGAVTLVQGYTSCGCTTIQFDRAATLAPGDSTRVTLRFNPRGKGGEFEETGTIVYTPKPETPSLKSEVQSLKSKAPSPKSEVQSPKSEVQSLKSEVQSPKSEVKRKRVTVSMVGTCISSDETLMRQFPVRISDDLRLSADRFDLGIVHVGETKSRHVAVLHLGEGRRQEQLRVSFTPDRNTPKGLQHIACPVDIVDQGQRRTVSITFDVIVK